MNSRSFIIHCGDLRVTNFVQDFLHVFRITTVAAAIFSSENNSTTTPYHELG